MEPIVFPEAVKVLQRPSTMSTGECQSLPVWNDGKQCVSCWRATFKERLQILFIGKVWLGVLSGKSQPPVFVSGEDVFIKPSFLDHFRAFWCEIKESIAQFSKSLKKGLKQPDKWKHYIAGCVICAIVGFFSTWWIGITAATIAGIVKEWYDSTGLGCVEKMDFVFTLLGALTAAPLIAVINLTHLMQWLS